MASCWTGPSCRSLAIRVRSSSVAWRIRPSRPLRSVCLVTSAASQKMRTIGIRKSTTQEAAITGASISCPRAHWSISTAGAISEAPARTASRRGVGWRSDGAAAALMDPIDGCSAAQPDAIRNAIQPVSITLPGWKVPWTVATPRATSAPSSAAIENPSR
jgi:hypothetical protein